MRSDKDSEPETNGEGIKKEIQYRRAPCLSDQLFRLERCFIKDPETSGGRGKFLTRPGNVEFAVAEPLADFSVGGFVG